MSAAGQSAIIRFLTCGSVDDGKSTLIGHLLHATGNVCLDQLEALVKESRTIGNAGGNTDYSLLLDGLLSEREQGITIDVAYRYFSVGERKYIVADTPGHAQYTRNMVTGSSNCDAAMVLVDSRSGVLEQTRRHALVCALMGIGSIAFICNKMDLSDWREGTYERVKDQCRAIMGDLSDALGAKPAWSCIPVSALRGDSIVSLSPNMPWYRGDTVLQWLSSIEPGRQSLDAPFRMAVEYVIKPGIAANAWQKGTDELYRTNRQNFRSYAGQIISGSCAVGDAIAISGSGQTARIVSIFGHSSSRRTAKAGASVSVEIDEVIDISRGVCLSHSHAPIRETDALEAYVFWMQDDPLLSGRSYIFKSLFGTSACEVTRFLGSLDLETYRLRPCDAVSCNEAALAELSLSRAMPFDPYAENRRSGGFIVIDRVTNATAGCGMIVRDKRRANDLQWHDFTVTRESRARLLSQRPCVVWFTGLSGSGKSTIAEALQTKLHGMGKLVYLLDGDNLRHGLNHDLGFTEKDRIENVRRTAHVASILMDAGVIVLVSLISPYKADREKARELIGVGNFIEAYVSTSLETCMERDPKGLYKKALAGEISNFTGVSAPYEAPSAPEIELDTSAHDAETLAARLATLILNGEGGGTCDE